MLGGITRSGCRFVTSLRNCYSVGGSSCKIISNDYKHATLQNQIPHKYTTIRSFCTSAATKTVELAESEPTTETVKKPIPTERLELLQSLFLKSGAKNFESQITCEHLQQTLIDLVDGQHDSVTRQIIEKVKSKKKQKTQTCCSLTEYIVYRL